MNHGLSKTNKVIPSTVEMLPSVFGQFSAWDYLHCQVFIGKLMPLGTMEPHQMCGLDSCLGKMHSSQRTWWRTATKLCGKLRLVCRLLLLLLSTCCITAVTLYPHQTQTTSQTTCVSRNKELWIICRILWTQRNNNGPTSPVGFLLLLQPYLLFETSAIYFYANGIKVNEIKLIESACYWLVGSAEKQLPFIGYTIHVSYYYDSTLMRLHRSKIIHINGITKWTTKW